MQNDSTTSLEASVAVSAASVPPHSSDHPPMLNVALIGSSGGGMATVGHSDAHMLLQTIHQHLSCIHARLVQAMYICLLDGKSMDSVQPEKDRASLIVVSPTRSTTITKHKEDKDETSENHSNQQPFSPQEEMWTFQIQTVATDTLDRINQVHAKPWLDERLAKDVQAGSIDALICISMHVPLCQTVLQAAVQQKLPVTGSGGSSLAQAAALGVQLVGNAGGSVATTTQTRAMSYTYSLARAFQRTHMYQPWQAQRAPPPEQQQGDQQRSQSERERRSPKWTSVLNAALPAFWAVTLTRWAFQQIRRNAVMLDIYTDCLQQMQVWLASYSVFTFWSQNVTMDATANITSNLDLIESALDHFLLPAVCAILMATSSSVVTDSSTTATASLIMSSAVASFGCCDSILAGLVTGYLVQCLMERWVMIPCIVSNVPATMTTLLAAGGLGSCIGLLSMLLIAPVARSIAAGIRWAIHWTVVDSASAVSSFCPIAAAFLWGCASCASSKVGYYHVVHLPLILIELETSNQNGRGGSFLGAVDELTLVLVCAGVCAGKVLATSTSVADRALCRRGFIINLLFGDFVEVCYPYMEQSTLINVSGYLASGLSCAVLVADRRSNMPATFDEHCSLPGSLAYLPWIGSVVLAGDHWFAMLQASIVAFVVPFVATLASASWTTRQDSVQPQHQINHLSSLKED
ncbi:hypothetical protein ACA910_014514 [Epithemia clementina (nom. ined.)]